MIEESSKWIKQRKMDRLIFSKEFKQSTFINFAISVNPGSKSLVSAKLEAIFNDDRKLLAESVLPSRPKKWQGSRLIGAGERLELSASNHNIVAFKVRYRLEFRLADKLLAVKEEKVAEKESPPRIDQKDWKESDKETTLQPKPEKNQQSSREAQHMLVLYGITGFIVLVTMITLLS
mmetsp:Transcript_1798/g.2560  ORF Transcript_1798/g.2560 Transcript_1798/m.2560 type:complete len:177 (+) Transcript_1798:60-590(+)